MAGKYPGLIKRGNVWYVRRRVPKDVVTLIGRDQVWRSLGTGDRSLALKEYWSISNEIEQLFAQARRRDADKQQHPLSEAEVRRFARDWLSRTAKTESLEILVSLGSGNLGERLRELDAEEGHLISGAEEEVQPSLQYAADQILIANGFPPKEPVGWRQRRSKIREADVDKSNAEYWLLVDLIRAGSIELIRRNREQLNGAPAGEAFERALSPNVEAPKLVAALRPDGPSISELITKFLEADQTRSERTNADLEAAFRLLREIVGAERDISTLQRRDLREVRDLLVRLPRHAKLSNARKQMSLVQFADDAEARCEPTLHVKTVNKYLGRIAALMQWAEDEMLIDRNPAKNLRLKKADQTSDADARDPFSASDLVALFCSEEFSTNGSE